MQYDSEVVGSWAWDVPRAEILSYETVQGAREKVRYVVQKRLGSTMFREAAGGKPGEGESIVWNVTTELGLLRTGERNWLAYLDSRYENVRRGMEEGGR